MLDVCKCSVRYGRNTLFKGDVLFGQPIMQSEMLPSSGVFLSRIAVPHSAYLRAVGIPLSEALLLSEGVRVAIWDAG